MHDTAERHALVFAIAHEIGNHLAGIRLEAHLLDEELGVRGLAKSSLAIDSLAGQSGPLLALLRPLLAPSARPAPGAAWAGLLEGVRRQLEDEGFGGRVVEVQIECDRDERGPAIEGLHALLLALVGSPDTLPSVTGPITLGLARREGALELACELPGEVFEGEAERGVHSLRGRPLALAIARVLAEDAGGRVELHNAGNRARVSLLFPSSDGPRSIAPRSIGG